MILNDSQVRKKVKRMAYEILESNFKQKELLFAGVTGQGFVLANMLEKELKEISSIKTSVIEILINKSAPQKGVIELSPDKNIAEGISVILVDDVLNTGRTLSYSLKPFLDMKVPKIEVAVLIDREHEKYPINAKFTGLSLSTTLNDHVEVVFNEADHIVYLT